MILKYEYNRLLLIPEDARDWGYVQQALGLLSPGDTCIAMRISDTDEHDGAIRLEPAPPPRQADLTLRSHIDELELGVRAANGLHGANVRSIYEVIAMGPEGVLKIRHLGRRSYADIAEALLACGHPFGEKLPSDLAKDAAERLMPGSGGYVSAKEPKR